MRLGELLDVEMLRKLAEANYRASGMPVGIVDAVDGSVLVGVGWQDICTTYHRANAITLERCRESDDFIKRHLSEQRPCEYTCRNGLRDIGVPIRAGGRHLATLFLGQFFYEGEAPERAFFAEQARRFGFDESAYLAALDRVPVFKRTSVENILTYNTALAGFISDLADGALRRRAAEDHAESLARFPEENPDPVLRLTRDLEVVYANAAARSALAVIGLEVSTPAPRSIRELAERALREGKRVKGEVAAGDRCYVMSGVAVGQYVNVYAHDITERKLAEQALARERALVASVMQATDVMLVYLDREFNFVWVNDAYAAACNMTAAEMVGKNHFALYPNAENEAIFRNVRDAGEPVFYKDEPFEFPARPGRGVTYWDWSLVPVKDASGRVVGLVFSPRETTKFKRAELELDAERMRWRGVVEGIADEVWVCDRNGRMTLINLPEKTAMGLQQFEAKTVHEVLEELEILYPDGRPRPPDEAPLLRSLRSGEVVRGEEMMRHRKGGKLRWRQFSCAPMRDAGGRITGAVAIVRDVTETKKVEQQLREANRAKDDFIGMLSHELRNPLAPITNSLFILEHAEPAGEQAHRAKEVIGRQVRHLARLVDDLLEVTRISRGKVELHRTRLDLCQLVRRAGEDHRDLLQTRGLGFTIEAPGRPIWVEGDETRLAQVVGNLLRNAAKFTPNGGQVTLSVVELDGTAEVHVRDTGAGVDPLLIDRIFEPFTQGKQTLARTEGGLGLGLALVKAMVELHGGSVQARSGGEGQGAELVVRLPAVLPPPSERPGTRDVQAPARRLRILIVEDNVDSAESLAELARMYGHEVEIAYDGPTAVEKAKAMPAPDLVLCDIGLPGMDGYDVARAIRSNPSLRLTRLVAVSGYAQPEDVRRATDAGFIGHIAKPPDPAALERYLVTP